MNNTRMFAINRAELLKTSLVCALTALALMPRHADAQSYTYSACYIPWSGTVYRIKAPGLRTECGSSEKDGKFDQHVEFSWTSGVQSAGATVGGGGKTTDHGSLAGLTDDDHTQYMLADGVRTSVNGFAVTATPNQGSIPVSGEGMRLMWYPRKAAFRAGGVIYDQWDDANTGLASIAMGWNTVATAFGSVALGSASYATGHSAAALVSGRASGSASFAVAGEASGRDAVAMGQYAIASGERSMAFGPRADTNGQLGATVFADASDFALVKAATPNHFVVRASRMWLGSNNNVTATVGRFIETSTGAYLSSGGAWVSSSDIDRKMSFLKVETDDVLAKVAALPIHTWQYKDEQASTRHMGPTAQDFYAAFGLGDNDKGIATVDADGVSLAAIQALEQRTTRQAAEFAELRSELAVLRQQIKELRN